MNIKSNKKAWLGAMFSFALVAIMGLTFAFKAETSKNQKEDSYFFRYDGTPGSESNKALWTNVSPSEPSCSGTVDGCLIEVAPEAVTTQDSEIVLLNDVPVTSGTHKNPIIGDDILSASYRN